MSDFAGKPTQGSRFAHWVLKVGNLKESLRFLEGVLGLRVLRHEEFTEGCEATCNGPYAGAWSKTMVGYGPERDNFALELTYNYGIDSYASGDDLHYIAVAYPMALERAKLFGYAVDEASGTVTGPDGYRFKIVPEIQGRAERFVSVAIRVSDAGASEKYWCGLLGLTKQGTSLGCDVSAQTQLTVGFGAHQVSLQLLQTAAAAAAPVDHALSGGRAAFACGTPAVPAIHAMVTGGGGGGGGSGSGAERCLCGGAVLTQPLTLPTPGKADVVVTILADPDDYEICFVEDAAFYDLATPTYDVVDWGLRATRGGDGAPPPKAKLEHAASVTPVKTEEDLDQLIKQAGGKAVLLEFGAGWCKNCKKLAPTLEQLASAEAARMVVGAVDIDEAQDLADAHGVTRVPHVLLLKAGAKAWEHTGPTKEELKAGVARALQ
eukprot:TRINITY_DN277_c4_g4_i2.p1 TRINITY_DN277_c4_g4~~TRINITY_DN277_c4_g4_i2.p1  ORF type:complete len:453 (-),score=134.16 TRINITY_DN277_c4_g4_i2:53-1354(-)